MLPHGSPSAAPIAPPTVQQLLGGILRSVPAPGVDATRYDRLGCRPLPGRQLAQPVPHAALAGPRSASCCGGGCRRPRDVDPLRARAGWRTTHGTTPAHQWVWSDMVDGIRAIKPLPRRPAACATTAPRISDGSSRRSAITPSIMADPANLGHANHALHQHEALFVCGRMLGDEHVDRSSQSSGSTSCSTRHTTSRE